MIRRPIEPLKMLFVMQGSYFKRLIVPQVLLFIFSFLIYFYQTHIATEPVPLNPSVFAILGISLAIFHGFCNNAAYDRFWEGRKLWGTLVWLSRNIARQVLTLPNVSMAEKQAFIRHQIAFVHSLRQQLRAEDNTANLQRLLTVEEQQAVVGQNFIALRLTQIMGQMLANWQAEQKIDVWQWQSLDNTLGEIAHIQAGCERINNTPIPYAYFVLLHRTVYLYCFMLPFGLGNAIGWVTPFVVSFVGYTFMALNEIVDEISEPFGTGENELPLGMMCDTIETQLAMLSHQQFAPEQKPRVPANVVI
ncbi:bestrophin family protein [Moraxella sp. CTOTU49803]|uniref:bestrophin family protein n=1 Tax=Moraxella sp. CTOTU49803 TaxID=2953840 RepID=UPI0028ACF01C|nr:bestrophin family ion channel [Moraxella sp. CTOTU49803]